MRSPQKKMLREDVEEFINYRLWNYRPLSVRQKKYSLLSNTEINKGKIHGSIQSRGTKISIHGNSKHGCELLWNSLREETTCNDCINHTIFPTQMWQCQLRGSGRQHCRHCRICLDDSTSSWEPRPLQEDLTLGALHQLRAFLEITNPDGGVTSVDYQTIPAYFSRLVLNFSYLGKTFRISGVPDPGTIWMQDVMPLKYP